MFLRLVRARLQMAWNTVRAAPHWQQGVIGALSLFALGLFAVIALASAALVLLTQGGAPPATLSAGARALIGRMDEYLFFFLLAGSVPFVAGTLFQADDLGLLLSTPLAPRTIVGAKLLDAVAVNAAQFVFLGVPVLVGLGIATGQHWGGWLWLILATLLLLALPPAITAWLLLLSARFLGLRRVRAVVTLVSVALGLAITTLAVLGASRAVRAGSLDLPRLQAALHGERTAVSATVATETAPPWLPSAWAAAMLESTAGGHKLDPSGRRGLGLLSGATLLFVGLCLWTGQNVLTSEAVLEQDRRASGGPRRRVGRIWGASSAVSGLLLKDQRYLVRDLILLGQIGTALILFLVPFLLKVAQGTDHTMDNDLYGGLALAMLGLIVYMVTSIVGLSSVGLEGRGFWLVLASPVGRLELLRAKWLGAFAVSATVVSVLTLIAWRAFALSGALALLSWIGFLAACLALSGLGVGLSGLFPRFVYENPAHRASVWALVLGFVLATGYVLVCGLGAGGLYVSVAQHVLAPRTAGVVGGLGFLLVSGLTGWVPVSMAARRLDHYDWEY